MANGVRDTDIGYPRLNEERDATIIAVGTALEGKFNDLSSQLEESNEEFKKVRRGIELLLEQEIEEVE